MLQKSISVLLCLIFSAALYGQCYPDRHSTILTDNWVSCEKKASPNEERDDSHWIMYDLGAIYALGETTIWNCNAFDNTDMGVSSLVIDYSLNGQDWNELEVVNLEQADASGFYEGADGPNFEGLPVRYVLLTSLGQFGNDCACLSEVRFGTTGETTNVADLDALKIEAEVSPNPASDLVQLKTINTKDGFDAEIILVDQIGREVKKMDQYLPKGEYNIEINTSEYPSGNYFLRIKSGESILTKKLILMQDTK